ncbi:MAG: DNA N-6-adenine-methyltransferase (plasmid) [Leptolyngbya sp. BL-A-14]
MVSDLRLQLQHLRAEAERLQAEGEVIIKPDFWLDSTQNGDTNQTDYYKRWFDTTGRQQSAPLAPTDYHQLKAAIERGQQLQALEEQQQQLTADLESLLAQQHGLPLPKQKSHDCAVQHSSESNEWYTPAYWVEQARTLMGAIDLDPATSVEAQSWIRAHTYYTKADNGLRLPWFGRLWLNPPYGKRNYVQGIYGATAWVERAIHEYQAGQVTEAVLWLRVNGNAGSKALEQAGFPRVTLGRIAHAPPAANGEPQKGVGHDTVVWYLGQQIERFQALFVAPVSGLVRSLSRWR